MNDSLPRSPLTTPLSGSAKEVELRLRRIFQGKKRRMPTFFLLFLFLLAICSGALVSCQQNQTSTQDTDSVVQLLLRQGAFSDLPEEETVSPKLLAQVSQGGYTLAAAALYSENSSHYWFVLGILDEQTQSLVGTFYQTAASGGQPHCIAITRFDNSPALLYTCNGFEQGLSYGESGLVALDGNTMTWHWPVEGDIRSLDSTTKADYDAYWQSNHALLSPGGVDVFIQTDYAVINGDGPQWTPDHNETFYATSEDELPIGVMYQTRLWLENFTCSKNNPLNIQNASALWCIQSLTPGEFKYPNQKESELTYTLLARADTDNTLYFAAHILFDQETGTISTVYNPSMGTLEEITQQVLENPFRWEFSNQDQLRDALILAEYQRTYQVGNVCWLSQAPAHPQEHDVALGTVTYVGEATLYETIGVAFQVQPYYYSSGQWIPFPEPALIILSQGQDGTFQGVVGQPNFSTDGMAIEDIIHQTAWHLLDFEVCLYRDGYPNPIGPGNWYDLFNSAYEGDPEIQIMEDYAPIYYPGDYWEQWSVEGFSALCYYHAAEDQYTLNTLDVTRNDLYTPRGIRVGATRAEVQAAYPEAISEDYWGQYPGEDYLWYCKDSNGFGAAILFFFQGDTLTQITLNNMFD
ncbi:MAG: hypothetical protein ACOX7N_09470 [Lawsonibacter sp.]